MSFIGKKTVHNLTASTTNSDGPVDPQRPVTFDPLPDDGEHSDDLIEDRSEDEAPQTEKKNEAEEEEEDAPLINRAEKRARPTARNTRPPTTTTSPRPGEPEYFKQPETLREVLQDEEVVNTVIRYLLLFVVFVVLYECTQRFLFPAIFGYKTGRPRTDEEVFREYMRNNKLCERGERCEYDVSGGLG